MAIKNVVRKLHLTLALLFMAPLVIMGLSGSTLVFYRAIDEQLTPHLLIAKPHNNFNVDGIAREVRNAFPHAPLLRIVAPRHSHAAALAYTQCDQAVCEIAAHPNTGKVLGVRNKENHLIRWLYKLHSRWLIEPIGYYFAALCGLVLLVLVISGVFNWLLHPSRQLHWRMGGIAFLQWWDMHRALGLVTAGLLGLSAITGTTLALKPWINQTFAGALPYTPVTLPEVQTPILSASAAVAASAYVFPEATLSLITFPTKADVPYKISWQQPDEPRKSKGMSHVWVQPYSGEVLGISDSAHPRGLDLWLGWAFPLHNAEWGGIVLRSFWLLVGLAPSILAFSGYRLYRLRQKGTEKRRK